MNESIVKPVYLIYARELRGLPREIQTNVVQSQIKTVITLSVVTVSVVVTLKYILDRQSIKYMFLFATLYYNKYNESLRKDQKKTTLTCDYQ